MINSVLLLLVVVALTATAHLLLKIGMDRVGAVEVSDLKTPLTTVRAIISSPAILVAIPIYAASFAGWIVVISRLKLSVAYPGLGMMYALIPLLSWIVLKESVSALQWAGIALIVGGVLVVVRTGGA
ncbi:MAG: hypothetical protein HY678_05240 [Chloroflexi bacterium]|nr:hypothetical protein [Chloroflexota bacterium]